MSRLSSGTVAGRTSPQRVLERGDKQELGVDAEGGDVPGDLLSVAVQPVPRREAQHVWLLPGGGPLCRRRSDRHHGRPGARGGQGGGEARPRRDALRLARVLQEFPVGQLKWNVE